MSEDIDENVQILNLFLHLKEIFKIKEKFLGTILLLLSIVEFENKCIRYRSPKDIQTNYQEKMAL